MFLGDMIRCVDCTSVGIKDDYEAIMKELVTAIVYVLE